MNTTSDIEMGSNVCPSCKSDDWKSAKMVVMEGTTNTTGTLTGAVTDPGKLSGGIKNFLLSDRWFSWDYPIEATIGLTSSTGLVEEVKRLMVDHASAVQLPPRPYRPLPPRDQALHMTQEKLYKKELAKYETEHQNILQARKLLWDRARVCMRCGTAYLSGG